MPTRASRMNPQRVSPAQQASIQHQELQADEWTQVTTKSKSKRRRNSPLSSLPQIRNPPSKNITLLHIQAAFNKKAKIWLHSACRKRTLSILHKIQPGEGWAIEKAVCLGVGSFSRENGECRKRSLWQFVVFVDLVEHLKRAGKRDINVFVQEPQFTETDAAFLKTMRIDMLDVEPFPDPLPESYTTSAGLGAAVSHLGNRTFLYEPFMDMNEAMLSEIIAADVQLYIGSSMRGLAGRQGAVGGLAKTFERCHGVYQFPGFEEDPNMLDGMGIYWRPERDEEEDDNDDDD